MQRHVRMLAIAGLLVGAIAPGLAGANHCGTVTASPDSLWPPNHKLHTTTLTASDPDCDVDITSVTQDQATDARGSGHTVDFDATNCTDDPAEDPKTAAVDLRAERAGPDRDGRTYAIMWTADDDGIGQPDSGTATVRVPHDRRPSQPVDVDPPTAFPSGAVC